VVLRPGLRRGNRADPRDRAERDRAPERDTKDPREPAAADHSLEAGEFEGVHDGARRGTGAVIVWDEGAIEDLRDEGDHLSFTLRGSKLAGRFGLTRTGGKQWVLVKARDGDARSGTDVVAERPESVRSGRTWQQVAALRSPSR
jgi:bifunctional non-homologous end joining protein LigD